MSSSRVREMTLALQEVKDGRKDQASGRLLDLWRARRSSKLAEVLEHLAPAPITLEKNLAAMEAQLKANLLPRVPDPSVARAVLSFLRMTPFTSRRSKEMWLVVFDLLERAGDPRVPTELATIINMGADLQVAEAMREWLVNWMKIKLRDLPKDPPPDEPEETKALVHELALLVVPQKSELSAQREKTAENNRRRLLAAVYASPDDDGPREVLADHLLEENDPLGEFITLQLKNQDADGGDPPRKREEGLLKKHHKEWLGELFRFTRAGVVFRRGFPSEASLKIASAKEAEWAANLPAWATLEKVEVGWGNWPIPKTLHAVRELTRVRDETIPMLVAHPHLRPITLRCAHPLEDLDTWKELEASRAGERLKIVDNVPLRFISDSLRACLEEIHLPPLHTITQELADLLIERATKLRIFLRSSVCTYELYAAEDAAIHVVIHPNPRINERQVRGYGFEHLAKITNHLRTDGTPNNGAQLLLSRLEGAIVSFEALRDWDFESIGGSKGSKGSWKERKHKPPQPKKNRADDLRARAQTFFAAATHTHPSALAYTTRDGGTLIAAERGGLCAINSESGEIRAIHPTSDVTHRPQIADDGLLVVLQHARRVVFCDPFDGKRLHEDLAAKLSANPSTFQAMSANGRFVATNEGIIDLETNATTFAPSRYGFAELHSNGRRWLTGMAFHELLPPENAPKTSRKSKERKTEPLGPPQRVKLLPTYEGSFGTFAVRFLDPHEDESRSIVLIALQRVDNSEVFRVARVDFSEDDLAILYSLSYPGDAKDLAVTTKLLAIAHAHGITILDADSGAARRELRAEIGSAPALKVAFNKDATRLFYKTRDKLGGYDLEDDREIWSLALR